MRVLTTLILNTALITWSCGKGGGSDYNQTDSGAAAPKQEAAKPVNQPPQGQGGGATWNGGGAQLVASNCLRCHGSGSSLGDFSDFAHAKNAAARMNNRIKGGSMPPNAPLSDDKKALFQSWVDGGTPEG